MSSPLKNVSVGELEAAIAAALQKFSTEGVKFSISIKEIKFETHVPRVDIEFAAWAKHELGDQDPLKKFF